MEDTTDAVWRQEGVDIKKPRTVLDAPDVTDVAEGVQEKSAQNARKKAHPRPWHDTPKNPLAVG